jgi:DNA-directed RNA polymerase specialized sigma24 family protein
MGQYADVADGELTFQLYCAAQAKADATRNEILEEIAARHGGVVATFLLKHFRRALSEDERDAVLWDSLMELAQTIDQKEESVELASFWCRIARNNAIDHIRRGGALKRGGGQETLSLDAASGDGHKIDPPVRDECRDGIYYKELCAALEEEILKLDPRDQDVVRTMISLREAGLKITKKMDQELADRYETTAEYVKFLRYEAGKTLGKALEKRGFDLSARRRLS